MLVWSGPSYGETRPHGMRVRAGKSRIGAEYLACWACYVASEHPQVMAHAAPHVNGSWQLASVEANWFGRSSQDIFAQLRNPDLNGNRDYLALADHLAHDQILQLVWSPDTGREPATYSLTQQGGHEHMGRCWTALSAGLSRISNHPSVSLAPAANRPSRRMLRSEI